MFDVFIFLSGISLRTELFSEWDHSLMCLLLDKTSVVSFSEPVGRWYLELYILIYLPEQLY